MRSFSKAQLFRNDADRQIGMGKQALGFEIHTFRDECFRAHADGERGGSGQALFGTTEMCGILVESLPLRKALVDQLLKAIEA